MAEQAFAVFGGFEPARGALEQGSVEAFLQRAERLGHGGLRDVEKVGHASDVAGFVEAFNAGFQDGIKGSAVTIAETKNGDVGKEVQARLVEDLLQTHKDLDYLIGTAVMVEAAIPILRQRNLQDKVRLVSIYMTPGVLQALKSKRIEAAGSAPVVLMSRVLVDSAVRALENKLEYRDVGLLGSVYTPDNVNQLDQSTVLAPADFRPVFKLD